MPYNASTSGSTNVLVEKLFEQMSGLTVEEMRALVPEATGYSPLPMPTTSVYTKHDGVVGWETCIEPEDHNSENIQVHGSHAGLTLNPTVLKLIADRLTQTPESWRRFEAKSCQSYLYPER